MWWCFFFVLFSGFLPFLVLIVLIFGVVEFLFMVSCYHVVLLLLCGTCVACLVSAIYFCCPFSALQYKCAAVLLYNLLINNCTDFVFFYYVISILFGSWLSHYDYVYCSSHKQIINMTHRLPVTWEQLLINLIMFPIRHREGFNIPSSGDTFCQLYRWRFKSYGSRIFLDFLTCKMEAIHSSETSVTVWLLTCYNIREYTNLHQHNCENLQSHNSL